MLLDATATGGLNSGIVLVVYVLIFGAIMYFFI